MKAGSGKRFENRCVALEPVDFRRSRAIGGVRPGWRHLLATKAESGGSDRQIVVQLVPDEDVSERGDSRVQ